uniref:Uncharacterized protein n=1 Tax=Pyrodinium bahamense TaxID=73915 RepID=A0A7R9ZX11_9DINO|mmetsp:Transcript_13420/g.37112  ORF Transcript_13420/g.37112 Transcript_13420/m.37112 type:complete len:251 (+) Transcript_13420:176-928(+)
MGQGGGCCQSCQGKREDDPRVQIINAVSTSQPKRVAARAIPGSGCVAAEAEEEVLLPEESESPLVPPATNKEEEYEACPTSPRVTFGMVLTDLDGAEEATYAGVFEAITSGKEAVPHDSSVCRAFLTLHSSLDSSDLDGALFRVAPQGALAREGFLRMLREHPVAEGAALEHFLALSGSGEAVPAEACRAALPPFVGLASGLPSDFQDAEWDRILDAVMADAPTFVDIEQWLRYCKLVGRIVRLARYSRL